MMNPGNVHQAQSEVLNTCKEQIKKDKTAILLLLLKTAEKLAVTGMLRNEWQHQTVVMTHTKVSYAKLYKSARTWN